ncbi:hypothetical protein IF1G_07254 [Cordyceps javanica]|uniref:Uncharacterized protein n=1 Tax=Cordyceps javanica TaxID=43265 RepID=A0A545UY20_9HYPO|nr:hypothetical protein IF1G_07254 [Cordyceps javanica]
MAIPYYAMINKAATLNACHNIPHWSSKTWTWATGILERPWPLPAALDGSIMGSWFQTAGPLVMREQLLST